MGDYTAAAIASFSFSEVVPVVDGNVYRVLARYFGLKWDISDTGSKKKFFDLASELIPENDPATFNQGIMEFGALQCRPKLPDCSTCPLSDNCEAFKSGKTDFFPVKTKKQLKKDVYFYYIIFESGKRFLTQKRTGNGIWKG